MKLWLISQDVNDGYDTYDSAVVAAETITAARITNPGGFHVWSAEKVSWMFHFSTGRPPRAEKDHTWAHPDKVDVKYLGEADPTLGPGIILASFNAG